MDGLSAPLVAGLEVPRPRGRGRGGDVRDGVVFILSRERREKIASRDSWRGRRTTSRKTMRDIRLTSSSSPKPGMRWVLMPVMVDAPELVGRDSSKEEEARWVSGGGGGGKGSAGTKAPQNSCASLGLMILP